MKATISRQHFKIAFKTTKYLGSYLTKDMQKHYREKQWNPIEVNFKRQIRGERNPVPESCDARGPSEGGTGVSCRVVCVPPHCWEAFDGYGSLGAHTTWAPCTVGETGRLLTAVTLGGEVGGPTAWPASCQGRKGPPGAGRALVLPGAGTRGCLPFCPWLYIGHFVQLSQSPVPLAQGFSWLLVNLPHIHT